MDLQLPGKDALDKLNADAFDPQLFPAEVIALRQDGKGVAAWKLLKKLNRKELSPTRKAEREKHLKDLRLWLNIGAGKPTMQTINGVGTTLYGKHQPNNADQTYIATNWFAFVFVPIFPISSWLVLPSGKARSWYFLAKTPHPPWAEWQRVAVLVGLGLATATAAAAAVYSGRHGDVVVYNGFDATLHAVVGDVEADVGPGQAVHVSPSRGPVHLHATAKVGNAEPVEIETAEEQVDDGETRLWNVAGRGLIAREDMVYGTGEPFPSTLYDKRFFPVNADYYFVEPPKEIEMDESQTNEHRSVLSDVLREGDGTWLTLLPVVEQLQSPARAEEIARAELALHPDSPASIRGLIQVSSVSAAERAALYDKLVLLQPDDINVQRGYQNAHRADEAIVDRYRKAAEAAPTAANLYLYGRMLTDEAAARATFEAALKVAPDYPWAHYALGVADENHGRYAAAEAHFATACADPDMDNGAVNDRILMHHAQGLGPEGLEDALSPLQKAAWQAEKSPDQLQNLLTALKGAAEKDTDVHYQVAFVALNAGDLETARTEAAHTRNKMPDLHYDIELSRGGDRAALKSLLEAGPVSGQVLLAAAAKVVGATNAKEWADAVAAEENGNLGPGQLAPSSLLTRDLTDPGMDALLADAGPENGAILYETAAWLVDDTRPDLAKKWRALERPLRVPGLFPWIGA